MKKYIIGTAFLFLMIFSAAGAEKDVDSQIKKVTVYTDRALVVREADLMLEPGENRLLFDSLPERIDGSSLQVKGAGAAVLQDIQFKTVYLSANPDARIRELTASLQAVTDDKISKNDAVQRNKAEKQFLEKITAMVTTKGEGEQVELDPAKWIQMVDFYSTRGGILDKNIRDLERQIRDLSDEEQKLKREIAALSAGTNKNKKQALVVLQADQASRVRLQLSYLVYGPSWYPDYDIRVDSNKKYVDFSYNARVRQSTGENWSGVNLVLSTAMPHIYGKHPDLTPWYIFTYDVDQDTLYKREGAVFQEKEVIMPQMMENAIVADLDDSAGYGYGGVITGSTAAVETGATAVQFIVSGSHTIDSDNVDHKVTVLTREFSAAFRYSTVPKLSPFAYLKAKIKNNTTFPLLSGNTKVFLDGAFVANSHLEKVAPGEEFWTFLGVDEGIAVEYKQVSRDMTEAGIFGKNDKVTFHYEIKITSKKTNVEEIVVWDQLPVPGDKSIKITLLEPEIKEGDETIKMNEDKFIEWLKVLEPGQEVTIPFRYMVEYPKGQIIEGLF